MQFTLLLITIQLQPRYFVSPPCFLYSLRSPKTGGACYSSCIFWKWPVPSPTAEATNTGQWVIYFQGHASLQPHWLYKKTIICIWFPEGEESRERRRVWEVGGQVPLVMVSVRSQYCMLPLLISTLQQGQLLWKLLHRGRSSTICGGGVRALLQHTGHKNFVMGVWRHSLQEKTTTTITKKNKKHCDFLTCSRWMSNIR